MASTEVLARPYAWASFEVEFYPPELVARYEPNLDMWESIRTEVAMYDLVARSDSKAIEDFTDFEKIGGILRHTYKRHAEIPRETLHYSTPRTSQWFQRW